MSPGGVVETVEAFLFVIIIEDTTDIYRLGKGHKELSLSHVTCQYPRDGHVFTGVKYLLIFIV